MDIERPRFRAVPRPSCESGTAECTQVVIAGAGLVGLTLAIDLTRQGIRVVVLEKGDGIQEGSRSICQSKRTLEIWDRLGAAAPMVQRGITWKLGKVFHRDQLLYQFDLQPEGGHKMPAFINLQQYLVERYLLERLLELGGSVRWRHALAGLETSDEGVLLDVETPEGAYRVAAGWLLDCEGVRSVARRALGLRFEGETFADKFLITDVRLRESLPPERRFWFEPPFHDGQTALMHRQADAVWRIDLQLTADADPELERRPERVRSRIERMLGHGSFSIEWISVYVFQCRTLERYVHGRVIFAGDAAHQVSPFGARGGNGGVQDADNLAWKIVRVVTGRASKQLLATYDAERRPAADENIQASTRSTSFMTPKTPASRILRDATLQLARSECATRALVNPGRLSVPAHYRDSPLNVPDVDAWNTRDLAPGSPALDAPVASGRGRQWLLELLGDRFVLLAGSLAHAPRTLDLHGEAVPVLVCGRDFEDHEGLVAARYDLSPGATYLFRPDQHVLGRWRAWPGSKLEAVVARAVCHEQ